MESLEFLPLFGSQQAPDLLVSPLEHVMHFGLTALDDFPDLFLLLHVEVELVCHASYEAPVAAVRPSDKPRRAGSEP